MAIAKMKKLTLAALRQDKDMLLRSLIRLGCVELTEIEGEIKDTEFESLLKREQTSLVSSKSDYSKLQNAIAVLNKYAPEKSPLLSAKPEADADVLLDGSNIKDAVVFSDAILAADDTVKRITAEESRCRSVIEALTPWDCLDLDLSLAETERCRVLTGNIPASVNLSAVNEALKQITEEYECFRVSTDKIQHYLVVLCLKEDEQKLLEGLRAFGYTAANFNGMTGTARANIESTKKELKSLGKEKKAKSGAIVSAASKRSELKLTADCLAVKISMEEAEDKLYGTENTVILKGWFPEEAEGELEELFKSNTVAWETEVPAEEEYDNVPVLLKNNRFTSALNMVTNMYSLPRYNSVDPNPIMAGFFIVIYGLMFADMGYGLLMIIAAIVALKKIKPRGGTLTFCRLMLYGGISTLIAGALTGGFFGDAPYQIVHLINPESTWEGLPALFNPLTDSIWVLAGAMALGLIHLNTGMAVNVVLKCRSGDVKGAIFEEGALWVILIGAILYALKFIGVVLPVFIPLAVIIIGVGMMLWGAIRTADGIGKVTAPFSVIYNQATGWFGDILSYSRIMALMLAGSVIGQVFNTLAVMPSKNGVTPVSIIAFILIFTIGHALNFGLNLLGCFVHDLRLQCLEFFGKFYQDGGKPFSPLTFNTKYVNVKE